MKSPITWLPSLMLLGFLAVHAAQTPVATWTDTNANRDAEIRKLHQELKVISDHLTRLEAEGHHVVPRGGLSSTTELPANPAGVSAMATPSEVAASPAVLPSEDAPALSFVRGTTGNFGSAEYNASHFNAAVGRVILLRAYDVTNNSFHLNQATSLSSGGRTECFDDCGVSSAVRISSQ